MLDFPRDYRTIPLWSDVTEADWGDYRWQLRNRLVSIDQIENIVSLTGDEREGLEGTADLFRFGVSPHYATLIDPDDPDCPIRRQAIPLGGELRIADIESPDPLLEDRATPVPALMHRYPDRVLLITTHECPLYCRYCTRRRIVGDGQGVGTAAIEQGLDYIRRTPAIRDVLLSGGDPLILSDARLDWMLGEIRSIPHVEIVRIGTRFPVVVPQRITPALASVLRRHGPIWVNTHFNHPLELKSPATRSALELLADNGVPTGNQSVLLRDVNDCPVVLRRLVEDLIRLRCRPYYLYQCDLSEGLSAFRIPLEHGLAIMGELWGSTTGFAIPTFVVDAPGGGGKIPLLPNTRLKREKRGWVLRNHDGSTTIYPFVDDVDTEIRCRHCGGSHTESREKIDRTFSPSDVLSTGSSEGDRSIRTM